MTANQYRAALAKLNISQLYAARLFGLAPRSSRRYALDEAPIPHTVTVLLRLLLARKISPEDIEKIKVR